MRMIETDLKPSDIVSKKSFEKRDHGRYRAWWLNQCGTSSARNGSMRWNRINSR